MNVPYLHQLRPEGWRVGDGQLYVVNDDRYAAGSLAILNLHSSEFWFDDLQLWSFDS